MFPEKLYKLSIMPNYPDDEITVVDCTITTLICNCIRLDSMVLIKC